MMKNIFRFIKKKIPKKIRTFWYRKNSDCKDNEEKRKISGFSKGRKVSAKSLNDNFEHF